MKHGPWLSKVSYILDPLLDGDLECYSVGLSMCRKVEDNSVYGGITIYLHREGRPRAESVAFSTYAPPDRPELREQLKQALARLRSQADAAPGEVASHDPDLLAALKEAALATSRRQS